MGYNLWRSEDSQYSLGYRMGVQACETSAPIAEPERAPAASAKPSREEMDHIDFLMETLAARLESQQR